MTNLPQYTNLNPNYIVNKRNTPVFLYFRSAIPWKLTCDAQGSTRQRVSDSVNFGRDTTTSTTANQCLRTGTRNYRAGVAERNRVADTYISDTRLNGGEQLDPISGARLPTPCNNDARVNFSAMATAAFLILFVTILLNII